MQVHWTTDALEMLAAICSDLEQTSPQYAETVADTLIRRGNLLADSPYQGRALPEVRFKPVRELFVLGYRLIYYVGATQIEVFAIVHQAQQR
ncbi:MAG: type II toxin-antitoxin system RelE/ParE family toxin [Hymenobacter sp.]|nr:MAG: type II toxin-antitoxin system RelE/ParE family toxin [Hymenobacter sp.]